MAASRSKSFCLSMGFADGVATGVMTGRSGNGSFCYKATGKSFVELVEKLGQNMTPEQTRAFYDDFGSSTDGNVEVAGGEGIAVKPPNCT